MPLTIAERKERMPHGGQTEVAGAEDVPDSTVSEVMNGESRPKTKRTKLKIARLMRALARKAGVPVEEFFLPEELERVGIRVAPMARAS